MNIDRSFRLNQTGAISTTFTIDWYLRKGESRDKMGECLKTTTVRSQDQWRILQVNTHNFPSKYWRHKITKAKESNKCDHVRHSPKYMHSHTIDAGVSFTQNYVVSHPLNGDSFTSTGRRI